MIENRIVVTLCGSTRFKQDYEDWNRRLTMMGYVVFSCGVFGHANGGELSEAQKRSLDDIHLRKIDLSDGIMVLDVDGYVGNSSQKEIEYARSRGKFVVMLSKIQDFTGALLHQWLPIF